MAAIPCDPLGPGKARPSVPWRGPTAPEEDEEATLTSGSEAFHAGDQSIKFDETGNWLKKDSSGSRRIWSMISRRFRREHKLQ